MTGEGTHAVTARPLAGVLAVALLLTGCFGDPPPDPRTAPLEVVVESSKAPDQPCLLNRGEVAAGEHEVTVIVEGGSGTVVIRDDAGTAVLEASVPEDLPPEASGGGSAGGEGPPEGAVVGTSGLVQLEEGTYTVECATPAGPVGTVSLQVTPADAG